jgi:hypothetical protein
MNGCKAKAIRQKSQAGIILSVKLTLSDKTIDFEAKWAILKKK